MLTDANDYLVAPEGADRGRDFAALRMRIESVFSELEEVGNELLGGYDAAVPQRSLALLERADLIVPDVLIQTHMLGLQARQIEFRGLLSRARDNVGHE